MCLAADSDILFSQSNLHAKANSFAFWRKKVALYLCLLLSEWLPGAVSSEVLFIVTGLNCLLQTLYHEWFV